MPRSADISAGEERVVRPKDVSDLASGRVPWPVMLVVRVMRMGAWTMMLAVGLAQLAVLQWWIAELALSASFHLGAGLFAFAAALKALGRSREAGAAVIVGIIAVGPWLIVGQRSRAAELVAGAEDRDTLVVLAANTFPRNPHVTTLERQVVGADAHLVVLPEPPPVLIHALARAGYRRIVDTADGTKYGLAVLERPDPRLEVEGATLTRFGARTPIAAVRFKWRGRPAVLYGVHPPAPTSSHQMAVRQRQLRWLTARVRSSTVAAVVAGDFNTAVVSPIWSTLTEELARPRGHSPATWPSPLGPFGLSIDHVLVTEHWRAGPEIPVDLVDSDHRGVRVQLQWR